jgi:hypothetical protein
LRKTTAALLSRERSPLASSEPNATAGAGLAVLLQRERHAGAHPSHPEPQLILNLSGSVAVAIDKSQGKTTVTVSDGAQYPVSAAGLVVITQ